MDNINDFIDVIKNNPDIIYDKKRFNGLLLDCIQESSFS